MRVSWQSRVRKCDGQIDGETLLLTVRTSLSAAYKRADGRKIDGRRVVVDVERGRTVKGWRPRRLGKKWTKEEKQRNYFDCA